MSAPALSSVPTAAQVQEARLVLTATGVRRPLGSWDFNAALDGYIQALQSPSSPVVCKKMGNELAQGIANLSRSVVIIGTDPCTFPRAALRAAQDLLQERLLSREFTITQCKLVQATFLAKMRTNAVQEAVTHIGGRDGKTPAANIDTLDLLTNEAKKLLQLEYFSSEEDAGTAIIDAHLDKLISSGYCQCTNCAQTLCDGDSSCWNDYVTRILLPALPPPPAPPALCIIG